MLKLFFNSLGETSYQKTVLFLEKNNIPYESHRMKEITTSEMYHILSMTQRGTEDIISKRSINYKEDEILRRNTSLSELIEYLQDNPKAIKSPIVFDDRRLQIGYNEDDIRQFLNREYREANMKKFVR